MKTMADLMQTVASDGTLQWIGIRPERRGEIQVLEQVKVSPRGLEGDHYAGLDKRAVTLIQQEHLDVIAVLSGRSSIDPAVLRRNLVVRGINLLALRKARFSIGEVVLEGSGICAPCSYMEETIGPGGYSAMRGHGGITARVLSPGKIAVNDPVVLHAPNQLGEPQ